MAGRDRFKADGRLDGRAPRKDCLRPAVGKRERNRAGHHLQRKLLRRHLDDGDSGRSRDGEAERDGFQGALPKPPDHDLAVYRKGGQDAIPFTEDQVQHQHGHRHDRGARLCRGSVRLVLRRPQRAQAARLHKGNVGLGESAREDDGHAGKSRVPAQLPVPHLSQQLAWAQPRRAKRGGGEIRLYEFPVPHSVRARGIRGVHERNMDSPRRLASLRALCRRREAGDKASSPSRQDHRRICHVFVRRRSRRNNGSLLPVPEGHRQQVAWSVASLASGAGLHQRRQLHPLRKMR